MASSSTVPSVSKMVELHANGLEIPILFPIDANGFASVSSLHFSIRFSMQDMVVYCVVTEANLGIMSCHHDTYPSRHYAG
jgi:hypothetical protein